MDMFLKSFFLKRNKSMLFLAALYGTFVLFCIPLIAFSADKTKLRLETFFPYIR